MALPSGTRIGPYEVVAPLGAGGMGEVYRARDTRLNRDVAIKVLPEAFASDPERVARFEREAQLLASLNHPHIASIYGLEGHAIVLELVEGPTLADRIAGAKASADRSAPPIPLDETLLIARQIAEALEAAHEKGVVHRDLKPANIKLTPDGDVKVLDFGLAKLLEHEKPDAAVSQSPTLSVHATFAGVILGTAPYMSPEQARGRPVDKRADIWAFGCVLFEMITGRRAFDGEDVTETLGAVIHKEPPWDVLPTSLPPAVRHLLHRCLQKDPKQRLRDIGDARIELATPVIAPLAADHAPPGPASARRASLAGWAVAAALAIVAAGLALERFRQQPAAEPLPIRFEISPPNQTTFGPSPVVSPDGRRIVFTARNAAGQNLLWVRSLDAIDAQPLPGTENPGNAVFWSPDSRFVAFAAAGKLKKVETSGGPPVTLCEMPGIEAGMGGFRAGTWGPAGVLIFTGSNLALWRVSESGGEPLPLSTLEGSADAVHVGAAFLSDGRRFLFLGLSNRTDAANIYLGSLDEKPDQQTAHRLGEIAWPAVYAPSADPRTGYFLYLRENTLVMHRFDTVGLTLQGDTFPLAENLPASGPRAFSAGASSLVYRTREGSGTSQLLWFDRHGKPLGALGGPGAYGQVDLSPDGKTAAFVRTGVWSFDVARGTSTRVNPGSSRDAAPVVSSDGRVAFTMASAGSAGDLYSRFVSGADEPELLVQSPTVKHANDWSHDRRFLIYDDHHPTRRQDLWLLPLTGDRKPVPVLVTDADETLGRFSPDGKWIVYRSDESGQSEIYVRDFAPDRTPPIGSGRWTISRGGDKPHWSADGKEIYYIASDGTMMAVSVTIGATFQPGVAVPLFKTRVTGYIPYDVTPDGRFLINTPPDAASVPSPPITVVLNWQSLMNR